MATLKTLTDQLNQYGHSIPSVCATFASFSLEERYKIVHCYLEDELWANSLNPQVRMVFEHFILHAFTKAVLNNWDDFYASREKENT